MASCGQLAEDMDKITQKFDDLKGSDQWEKIAAKVYHESKDKIEAAVRMQLDQWKKHKFFYSGSYAGYVEKFFLDNMRDE